MNMPLLSTTCPVSYRTPVPVPFAAARPLAEALLHDPVALMRLDAGIASMRRLDRQPSQGAWTAPPAPDRAPWEGRTADGVLAGGSSHGNGGGASSAAGEQDPDYDADSDAISTWLQGEGRRLARETGAGWVEYWEVAIPHPLGRWMGALKYYAAFANVPDGVRVTVEVPGVLGMRSWTSFSVEEASEAGAGAGGPTAVYVEEGRIECVRGFEGTIRKEHSKGHAASHGAFVKRMVDGWRKEQVQSNVPLD